MVSNSKENESLKIFWFRIWVVLSVAWCAVVVVAGIPLQDGKPTLQELEARMQSNAGHVRQKCTIRSVSVDLDFGGANETLCFRSRAEADVYFKWLGRASSEWFKEDKRQKLLSLAAKIFLLPIALVFVFFAFEWVLRGLGRSLFSARFIGTPPANSIFESGMPEESISTDSHVEFDGNSGSVIGGDRVDDYGVRGWLKAFCVILVIVFPITALSAFSDAMDYHQSIGYANDPVSGVKYIVAVGSGFMAFWSFISGIIIWRGSPDGKRVALFFLSIYPIIAALTAFAAAKAIDTDGYASLKINLAMYVLVKLAFSAIWISYFLRSRRIKGLYR